jgi:hypothetical protein
MVPEEKARYEKMAAEDRERYNHECAVSPPLLFVHGISRCGFSCTRWRAMVAWLRRSLHFALFG